MKFINVGLFAALALAVAVPRPEQHAALAVAQPQAAAAEAQPKAEMKEGEAPNDPLARHKDFVAEVMRRDPIVRGLRATWRGITGQKPTEEENAVEENGTKTFGKDHTIGEELARSDPFFRTIKGGLDAITGQKPNEESEKPKNFFEAVAERDLIIRGIKGGWQSLAKGIKGMGQGLQALGGAKPETAEKPETAAKPETAEKAEAANGAVKA